VLQAHEYDDPVSAHNQQAQLEAEDEPPAKARKGKKASKPPVEDDESNVSVREVVTALCCRGPKIEHRSAPSRRVGSSVSRSLG
jgi:hypothetical protein